MTDWGSNLQGRGVAGSAHHSVDQADQVGMPRMHQERGMAYMRGAQDMVSVMNAQAQAFDRREQ